MTLHSLIKNLSYSLSWLSALSGRGIRVFKVRRARAGLSAPPPREELIYAPSRRAGAGIGGFTVPTHLANLRSHVLYLEANSLRPLTMIWSASFLAVSKKLAVSS